MRCVMPKVILGIIVCFFAFVLPEKGGAVQAREAGTYDFYQDGSGKNITADDAVKAAGPTAPEELEGVGRMSLCAVAMSTSNDGISLLKQHEGCRLTAYKAVDTEQYYTIGYGHYGEDVKKGMTITQAQAEELLKKDLVKYETSVNNFLNRYAITLSQKQFDALVSLTYNCGDIWSKYDSFVLKTYLINGVSNYSNIEVMNAFRSWKYSVDRNSQKRRILPGLVHRRMAEAAYFLEDETVAVYCQGNYRVDNETLNVRTGPSTKYDKVATVAAGAELNITEIDGYWGKYETGWVCLDYCTLYFARATISSITNGAKGVTLKWNQASDAAEYQIMRKDADGSMNIIGNTTKESYTDTTAVSGGTYYYYVNSVREDGTVDEETSDRQGMGITYIARPVLTSISNTSTGIKLKWKKSGGAAGYRILRKKKDGSWKKLAVVTENSYVDTTVASGTAYTYSVRCVDASGKDYTSSYDKTGLTISFLARPTMSAPENKQTGIKVAWGQIAGATGYYVYRQTGNGSWEKVKSTKSLSWADKKALSNGKQYKYKVYAYMKGADGAVTQSAASASKTIYRLNATEIKSLTNLKYQKLRVTYKKNKKASGYQIEYSRYPAFKLSKTAAASSTGTTLSGLWKKQKYYVRVRSYIKVGKKTYYSAWCKKKSVKITK